MRCLSARIMLSGSFGSGKTYIGCEKAKLLAQIYPGNHILIVRKAYNTLKKSTLWTLTRGKKSLPPVLPPELIINHHRTDHLFEIRTTDPDTPSYISYCGIDDPDRLGSYAELGAVFIDEGIETEEVDWSQLAGRLRLDVPIKQIYTATNPGNPNHYLYKMFYNPDGSPKTEPRTTCIESNSLDNYYLDQDYLDFLNDLEGVYRERYVLGKWVSMHGTIYGLFTRKMHICPMFKPPTEWDKWVSVDFGVVHPNVIQWWTEAKENYWAEGVANNKEKKMLIPKGACVMYREIYHTGLLYEDSAKWGKRVSQNERLDYGICDWDAEGRLTYKDHWMSFKPAQKHVETGIQEVYRRLKIDGSMIIPSSHIFFCEDARCHPPDQALTTKKKPTCTVDEFPGYQRRTTGERAEEPIKKNDDGMDATRYAMMSRKQKEANKPLRIRVTRI